MDENEKEIVAVQLDGDAGGPRLETCDGFQWIIKGVQAGAQWRSLGPNGRSQVDRHLGGPSPHNAKDNPLCLWLGLDEVNGRLLVLLAQSVKLRAASSARPRRMFLVIPAESLTLTSHASDFASIPLDHVPEALFERPSDARSANSNGFLHIAFTLDPSQTSRVAMPMRPYEHQARGTALSILDSLRSLSASQHFDLYLKFNSYARLGLVRLQAALKLTRPLLTTPSINLRGMCRGGRDGGFDLWREQGWHDVAETSDMLEARALKRYASPDRGTPPRCRRTEAPAQSERINTPSPPPPAYPGRDGPVLTRGGLSRAVVVAVAQSCSPDDYPWDNLSVTSEVSRVRETPDLQGVQSSVLTSASSSPLPSARLHKEFAIWLSTVWRRCPYAHYMFILDLLTAGAAAKREDSEGYHLARVACTRRFIAYEAAHMANDDFAQVLAAHPPNGHSDASAPDIAALTCEPSSLISWMLIVDPSLDTLFFGLLTEMEKRRKHALDLYPLSSKASSDQNEKLSAECHDRVSRYLDIKSLIVIEVCFQYGTAALERKDEIAEKMDRELDRQSGKP